MNEKNRGNVVVLGFLLFSIVWGYGADWLPYYTQLFQGQTVQVLGSLNDSRTDCSESIGTSKCTDEYRISVSRLSKGLTGMSLGLGYFTSDVTIGCFDSDMYNQVFEFGKRAGDYKQANPYRDYRTVPLDLVPCKKEIVIKSWNRAGDARHGLIGGHAIYGETTAVEAFRRFLDYFVNGLMLVFALMVFPIVYAIISLKKILKEGVSNRNFFVTIYFCATATLFVSGFIQITFPFEFAQSFYRQLLNLFYVFTMFLTAHHYFSKYSPQTKAARLLKWLRKPILNSRYDYVSALSSPAFIFIMLLVFPIPLWQFRYVWTTMIFSVFCLIFSPRKIDALAFSLLYFFSNLKMFNFVWAPESISSLFLVYILMAYELFQIANSEILRSLASIIDSRFNSKVAANIIHDIRSPLAVIKLLITQADWKDQHEVRDTVVGSIERIRDISSNVLSEHKKVLKGRASIVDIKAAIDDVSLSFPNANPPTVRISSNLESTQIDADPTSVYRIFQNILKNAFEVKGVTQIVVRANLLDQNEVEFSISNDGVLPSRGLLTRILAEGGTFGKEGGTGIGLSSVKNEIDSIGGGIQFDLKDDLFFAHIRLKVAKKALTDEV